MVSRSKLPVSANPRSVHAIHRRLAETALSVSSSHLQSLYTRQAVHLPKILAELRRTHGQKERCWAWWVFPTSTRGRSEPGDPTYVANEQEALELLATLHSSLSPTGETLLQLWIDVLNLIDRMPFRDKARAEEFLRQWTSYTHVSLMFPVFARTVAKRLPHIIRSCVIP